jgi:hypothetical protein
VPGALRHSVANVIRHLLIDLGLGSYPLSAAGEALWPIYIVGEPSSPDDVITVYNTDGADGGRVMNTGERQEHSGFLVRVRSSTHDGGAEKARAIAVAMDEQVYRRVVTVGAYSYVVHSISRTTDVIDLAKESLQAKRSIMTINARTSLRMR